MFLKQYLSTKEAVRIDFSHRTIKNYVNPFNEKPQPNDS